jgi:protein-disulfide isomerase
MTMGKADRQRTARDRLAVERVREEQRQKRNKAIGISVAAVAILAVVVGIGVWVAKIKNSGAATVYTGPLAPVTRETTGSITMAEPGVATPKLEIFEDFQCPICQQFEQTSGGTIKRLAAQGRVRVNYWPFQLFPQEPLAGNSQRAANAALCVPAGKWIRFHDTLYKNQPPEGTTGFSSKQLVQWGHDVGVTGQAFAACVNGLEKKAQLASMTTYAEQQRGISGTPTVFLNGKDLALNTVLDPKALEKAVLAAK